MGAKDPSTAQAAQNGAAGDGSPSGVPSPREQPVLPCAKKHWFSVRLESEKGKTLPINVKMRLKLNDGSTQDIVLSKAGQPDGKYSTDKILDLTDACEVSFPDLYDGECTPK